MTRVTTWRGWGVYHFSHDLLHEFGTFFNLVSWTSKLNNVTFLGWVRKINDNLEQVKMHSGTDG